MESEASELEDLDIMEDEPNSPESHETLQEKSELETEIRDGHLSVSKKRRIRDGLHTN